VDIWVLAEFFEEDFSERGGGSEAVAVGVKVEVMDGFEDFFFCFFPEAREFGDLAVEAGFFERADGVDAAELVEGFDFFWSEPLKAEELEERFGEFGAETLMIREGAIRRVGEGVELVLKGGADAFDVFELVVFGELEDIAVGGVKVFDGVGARAVGADFEGIFSF